ncbi:hypothetical protein ACGFRB_06970 [Streptomyces sp. NPDC048718]|uniref:hypothetical protein n=1 Tax=Streptomyces sp. NPDC048718 TaxID=3365587 RepID=UPI003710237F
MSGGEGRPVTSAALPPPDPADRRKVIVEPVDRPGGLDLALAPARRRTAKLLGSYSPEQIVVLFDYFTHAAEAYQEATGELQGSPGQSG